MRALVLASTIALTACSVHPVADCPTGATQQLSDHLFFGTATPDGVVSDADWQSFLRDEVTPRFPEGLTTWTADGQWRGADGIIVKEGSHVLQLLHPRDASAEASIVAIMAAYKARFRQEAVLRVTAPACTSF